MKKLQSPVEQGAQKGGVKKIMDDGKPPMKWNLMSYYYARSDFDHALRVRDNSELVMIDSGAHSFQKGKKVKWVEYTREYAKFIKLFDRPNVVGYFEMDVDNIIGYEKVLALRRILHEESGHADKIIPVWHKNRGITEFKAMCCERSGRTVAITGFKNEDIRDEQYPLFLKEAKKHGCKVHCLGMTRKKILDRVPFDYTDSSSWVQSAVYGKVDGRKVSRQFSKTNRTDVFIASYLAAMKMQDHYYRKWKRYE
ncbi:MAG: hypothetical protein RSG23_05095 [Gordonibacter sp.]